jgi:hypothetical protein
MLLAPALRSEPKSACPGPRITLDPALRDQPEWALAVQKTRRLVGERDVDTCASFDVSERRAGAVVRAELPDGRVTERSLAGPDELPKTLTALILLPPSSSLDLPALTTPDPPAPVPDRATKREAPATASGGRAARSSGFELGLGPASRFGYDAKAFAAVGASSFAEVRLDGWLVGLAGRASQAVKHYGAVSPDWSAERSFAAGLLLGRRFVVQRLELDAMLELPTFTFERMSYSTTSTSRFDDDDPGAVRTTTQDQTLTYTSVSAGIVLRASLPFSSLMRGYAALDADRSFSRFAVHDTSTGASPAVPLWGAGLSLGLRWNVL